MQKRVHIFLSLLLIGFVPLQALSAETEAAKQPTNPVSAPGATQSEVTGKGGGMGRDYQKSTPGPGQGEPDYRGGKTNTDGIDQAVPETTPEARETDAGQGNSAAGGKGTGKGPDAGGQGVGYPGYRGQGGEDSPHHRQYSSPPRGSSTAEENTAATSN